MRRILMLIPFALSALGLDNAVRINTPSAVTARPQSVRHHFHRGEIPSGKYPAPYVGGTILSTWQTDQVTRWPDGSVQHAVISWPLTASLGATTAVEFRPSSNACSSGNRAACDSAGLDQSGMLAFNGGTWTASLTATANPQGTSTAQTFDARAAVNAGKWQYWLRGPAVTSVIAGDQTSARSLDFGFYQRRFAQLNPSTGSFGSSDTTINLMDASGWAGLSTPFKIMVDSEVISICAVSGNALTVGVSGTCPSVTGRGSDSTTAAGHSPQSHGTTAQLWDSSIYVTTDSFSTITVNDASSISSATVFQIGWELVRICNKSGNVLTPGTGAWGCSYDVEGRNFRGSAGGYGNVGNFVWAAKTPVRAIDSQTDRWVDAPSATWKSIHPRAMLTFPTGWAGVGVQFILMNGVHADRQQDQRFDLSISVGGSTVYSQTQLEIAPRTMHRFPVYSVADQQYWAGAAPAEVRVDHNHAHLFSQGLIPWNPSTAVQSSTITSHLSSSYPNSVGGAPAWTSANNSKCAPDTTTFRDTATWNKMSGALTRALAATGGRDELGLSKHFALWVYSWGIGGSTLTDMNEMYLSHAACQGQNPVHVIESADVNFCNGWAYPANTADKACLDSTNQTATTFGRILSLSAFPTLCPLNQNVVVGIENKRFPAGPGGSANWQYLEQWSHGPSLAFGQAALTADYFSWLEVHILGGVAMAANYYASVWNTSSYSFADTLERGPYGMLNYSNGKRAEAWPLMMVTMGWLLAIDGTPERELFTAWLNRYWAQKAGLYNITSAAGAYYIPCPDNVTAATRNHSPWCFGRLQYGLGSPLTSWPAEPGMGPNNDGGAVIARAYGIESLWMAGYYQHVGAYTLAWGFDGAAPIVRAMFGAQFVRRTAYPSGYPLDLASYQSPRRTCLPEGVDASGGCAGQGQANGTELGFATMAGYYGAVVSGVKAWTDPPNDNDPQSGYALINGNVFELLPGTDYVDATAGRLTWHRSRDIWRALNRSQGSWATNPYWNMGLRVPVAPTITVGDTTARFSSPTMYPSCLISAATTQGGSDDSADTAATMVNQRLDHVLTGLTAATTYFYRLTCGGVRTLGTFTTAASAGGATTISIQTAPRSGQSITHLQVDYGTTTGLGSTISATSCSTSCTVSIPATAGRALYYQFTWLASGSPVQVGGLQKVIAQ